MIDLTLLIYQAVALLFTLVIPLLMLLGIIWFIAKVLKGFIRSLVR